MDAKLQLTHLFKRKGILKIAWGAIVLILLILGNFIAAIDREGLLHEDLAYQPPTSLLLQRLLYKPVESSVEATDFFESFEEFSTKSLEREGANWITSEPNYTAVIGQSYFYQVHVQDLTADARFSLTNGPAGMEIDPVSGLLVWHADGARGSKQEVEIFVNNRDGKGSRQRFPLFVSRRSHPFGTIQRGRDLLSGLVLGCTWVLFPGLVAAAISVLIGVVFGGYAGYYGGRTDALLTFVANLFGTFPALLLLFLAGAIFHFQIYPLMIVVGLISFPRVAAAIRSQVVRMKLMDFIEAARELGLKDSKILWNDIIWHNTRPLVMTFASYGMASAVLIQVTLSYLNLLIPVNSVSWGTMLIEGRRVLGNNCFWPICFPLVAIIVTIFGFYALADGITRMIKVKNE